MATLMATASTRTTGRCLVPRVHTRTYGSVYHNALIHISYSSPLILLYILDAVATTTPPPLLSSLSSLISIFTISDSLSPSNLIILVSPP